VSHTEVTRSPQGFHVGAEVFDVLVLAVPASVARKLLTGVLDRDLSGFQEIRATMAIHADPIYMPARRRDWRAFNAVRTGEHCEASIWYGGLRGTDEQIFKSWTTFRDKQPSEVIAAAEYWHPVITPETIRAQKRLEAAQGRDDLWFAGSWTNDVDSQESAVVSAVRIGQRLGGRPEKLAASVGAGISMAFAEALSDDGSLTGRGRPMLRGSVTGLMTTAGGIGHTLPFLISDFRIAMTFAVAVVAVELAAISFIRHRYMDTPLLSAAFQVVLGGVLVFLTGILIGSS